MELTDRKQCYYEYIILQIVQESVVGSMVQICVEDGFENSDSDFTDQFLPQRKFGLL